MKNGTFNTSKCRGKLQKMRVLYTHSPKSPGPFSTLPKKKVKFFFFKSQKMGVPQTVRDRVAVGGRPWIGDPWSPAGHGAVPFFVYCALFFQTLGPLPLGTFGQLFLIGSNTCPPCPNFSSKLQTSIAFDP
jgi:hypothetical protein